MEDWERFLVRLRRLGKCGRTILGKEKRNRARGYRVREDTSEGGAERAACECGHPRRKSIRYSDRTPVIPKALRRFRRSGNSWLSGGRRGWVTRNKGFFEHFKVGYTHIEADSLCTSVPHRSRPTFVHLVRHRMLHARNDEQASNQAVGQPHIALVGASPTRS